MGIRLPTPGNRTHIRSRKHAFKFYGIRFDRTILLVDMNLQFRQFPR